MSRVRGVSWLFNLPFHSSFHLSISVVQTDITHLAISSSHEFGCTFFLFWKHPFPKEEKVLCIDYIRHQKYFTFRLDGT